MLDILEQIQLKIKYDENELESRKKILEVLKSKNKYYIEQNKHIEEVENESEANIMNNGRYYRLDAIFNADSYFLYKLNDTQEKGELINIKTSIEDITYFILVEEDFNVRYFVSKLTHILDGVINNEDKFFNWIETKDVAYEVTREELEKIDKLLTGDN